MISRPVAVFLMAVLVAACGGATPATDVPAIGTWGVDLSVRDEGASPGHDFNRYANGRWLDSFQIPADLPSYGSFTKLRLAAEEDVRAIVEDLAASGGAPGSIEQKVGDFYASWMDEAGIESQGAAPLGPYLAQVEAIQTKADLMRAFGWQLTTSPFGIGIMPDPSDTTRYVVGVAQSGLGLPDRDYYLSADPRFVEYRAGYRNYMVRVMTLAGFEAADARADAIIDFETQLARVHWTRTDSRDVQKTYNPMPLTQLITLAPEVDWAVVMAERGLGQVDTVVVRQTTAIDAAAEIVDKAPLALMKDYLSFHVILNVNANASLSSDFDRAHFEFFDRTLRGTEVQRDRWKRAMTIINAGLGEAVGQVYVERHFPSDYKTQMEGLVANLVGAMEERLQQNEWMDEATRAQALTKLSTFEPRIGYPDKWIDYSDLTIRKGALVDNTVAMVEFLWKRQLDRLGGPVDRELWNLPPQTVNAFYNGLMNQITFPAGILQPPFFDPNADPAVNYGGIGAVIGHEIGHGFDDQGRRYDETGRIRDWWTAEADARFSERAERLKAQYDAYEALPGLHVNGQLTMGENLGDLGGLQMAYAAYHRYLDQTSGGVAPVIDGLSGDQRFFLAWAQVWRSRTRDDAMRSRVTTDTHSPDAFRINGVVRNMDAWYAAFDVNEGDALYLPPAQRVRIW